MLRWQKKGLFAVTAPLEYRKFIKLIKRHGCEIDEKGFPHIVRITYNGALLSTASVTHGKNIKGNEVKPSYVRLFENAIRRIKGPN